MSEKDYLKIKQKEFGEKVMRAAAESSLQPSHLIWPLSALLASMINALKMVNKDIDLDCKLVIANEIFKLIEKTIRDDK